MRIQPVAFLGLLACVAPAAFAQTAPAPASTAPSSTTTAPAPPSGQHERQPLDANHDGFITRDELQSRPGLARHFDEIDTNHDGKIDRDEFRAFHDQMKSRREQKKQQSAPAAGSSS